MLYLDCFVFSFTIFMVAFMDFMTYLLFLLSFSLFACVCVCGLAASFMLMPFAVLFFFDFGSILKR